MGSEMCIRDSDNLGPHDIWVKTEITGFKIGTDRGNYEGAEQVPGAPDRDRPRCVGDSNLGIALFADRKNEGAISHYKMAIKLNPNYTEAHYNLGVILLQKGEMKEAVHHFRKTLRLKPDLVAARDNLELALLRLQELE